MHRILTYLNSENEPARRDLLVLALLFGFAFFQFLGSFPLIEPDEARYAEIPREMLEQGDFVTPFLNYVKYFEKPPLHYWLNALAMSLFGKNEFAVRFPGALCGLLTVLATYHAGRKLFGRKSGFFAALILGSASGFLVQGRINFTDMTLTFCMSAALGSFLLASRENEPRSSLYYHLFYLFSALAVLAKGLIGIVLPGGILFLFILVTRRWRLLKEMRLPTGLLIFSLVAVPWFVLVCQRNEEFFQFFFIHEHFQRFLTKVHSRYEPFWYFIPILLLTMLPWSCFLPQTVVRSWKQRKEEGGDVLLYLLIWAGFIFLFFSKSNSKLIPYILPIFMPLALLTAEYFRDLLDKAHLPRRTGMLVGTLFCLAGGVAAGYPHVNANPAVSPVGGIFLGGAFLWGGILIIITSYRTNLQHLFIALTGSGLLVALAVPHTVLPTLAQKRGSSRELCRMVKSVAGPDTLVVSVGYEQGLPFYSERRVILAGGRTELDFGSRIGDQSAWFITKEQLPALWDSGQHLVVLIKQKDYDQLASAVTIPSRIIARDRRRLLISNR